MDVPLTTFSSPSVRPSVRPMLKDPIEKKLLCTEIVVSSAVAAAAPSSFVVELI